MQVDETPDLVRNRLDRIHWGLCYTIISVDFKNVETGTCSNSSVSYMDMILYGIWMITNEQNSVPWKRFLRPPMRNFQAFSLAFESKGECTKHYTRHKAILLHLYREKERDWLTNAFFRRIGQRSKQFFKCLDLSTKQSTTCPFVLSEKTKNGNPSTFASLQNALPQLSK